MSNLTKEELLTELDELYKSASIGDTWKLNPHSLKAYKQMYHIIQSQPEVTEGFKE